MAYRLIYPGIDVKVHEIMISSILFFQGNAKSGFLTFAKNARQANSQWNSLWKVQPA
jgi:hypothetical protein